jgi:hypothetical protein
MGFRRKCLMGCPKCKGDSCAKRQTEVISQVIVETGRHRIVCDVQGGMLHIAKNHTASIEMMRVLDVIELEDWVPNDGRVCKIGGLGFQR